MDSKFLKKVSKFLDPFLVLGIFTLFLIPVITVLNLTPIVVKPKQDNVLGAKDQTEAEIIVHSQDNENFRVIAQSNTEQSTSLKVTAYPNLEGSYTTTILTINNYTEDEKNIGILPSFENSVNDSKISVVVDDVKFVLRDFDGTTYPPSLYIQPGETVDVKLEIENEIDINHSQEFTITVN
jgi:hypothetical protein